MTFDLPVLRRDLRRGLRWRAAWLVAGLIGIGAWLQGIEPTAVALAAAAGAAVVAPCLAAHIVRSDTAHDTLPWLATSPIHPVVYQVQVALAAWIVSSLLSLVATALAAGTDLGRVAVIWSLGSGTALAFSLQVSAIYLWRPHVPESTACPSTPITLLVPLITLLSGALILMSRSAWGLPASAILAVVGWLAAILASDRPMASWPELSTRPSTPDPRPVPEAAPETTPHGNRAYARCHPLTDWHDAHAMLPMVWPAGGILLAVALGASQCNPLLSNRVACTLLTIGGVVCGSFAALVSARDRRSGLWGELLTTPVDPARLAVGRVLTAMMMTVLSTAPAVLVALQPVPWLQGPGDLLGWLDLALGVLCLWGCGGMCGILVGLGVPAESTVAWEALQGLAILATSVQGAALMVALLPTWLFTYHLACVVPWVAMLHRSLATAAIVSAVTVWRVRRP